MSIDRRHLRTLDRLVAIGRSASTAGGQIDERTCARKLRLATKALAKERAAIETRKHGVKTRAYECRICRGWHLTTQDPAEHRAEQRR